MTGTQMDSLERLKQHFAQRVINQARQLLEIWQNLHTTQWSSQELINMQEGAQRLLRYAERFEQQAHIEIAQALLENLAAIENNNNRLNSQFIETMTYLLQDLLQTGLRQGESIESVFLPPLVRKPILSFYRMMLKLKIALNNCSRFLCKLKYLMMRLRSLLLWPSVILR